ncbi:uncharacterized protein CC84DRAFT_1166000 [Paraphaeosphaeria sporulosa]|uniref:Uncharacterized protein n=1 Tax=Paraphaeosphaeria sporulosa TaxID=1460663 RepID=A0A177C8F7_9PLEO|nr:uncharacterized protein CC84DRAFT_1166000 [Paraphaeosphaeria sporulosa]OAG03835.1 hypothetical protein CC84DRAFT_1166000 [Paraphaeosphaeria sporulosa]
MCKPLAAGYVMALGVEWIQNPTTHPSVVYQHRNPALVMPAAPAYITPAMQPPAPTIRSLLPSCPPRRQRYPHPRLHHSRIAVACL